MSEELIDEIQETSLDSEVESPAESLSNGAEEAESLNAHGASRGPIGRDVPISALVHLLGLPTSSELSVIESKIDMIGAKLSSVGAKVDRLSQQIGTLANEFYIDRIDFQISEIRTLMKKVFPHVVREGDFVAGSLKEKRPAEKSEKSADAKDTSVQENAEKSE